MNVLASLFKRDGLIEKHQLEGVDPSDRYFNRAVLVNRTSSGYAAKAMYEALTVEGQSHPTIAAAVTELVQKLQAFGFSRLRTRANFKGAKYLAEKKPGSTILTEPNLTPVPIPDTQDCGSSV